MLSVTGRSDLPLLLEVLTRLDLPLDRHPIIVIGNQPFVADIDTMEEMRGSGQLERMLKAIGWIEESAPASGFSKFDCPERKAGLEAKVGQMGEKAGHRG